jgi:hypothetical protein
MRIARTLAALCATLLIAFALSASAARAGDDTSSQTTSGAQSNPGSQYQTYSVVWCPPC